jgi:hypothetical protein
MRSLSLDVSFTYQPPPPVMNRGEFVTRGDPKSERETPEMRPLFHAPARVCINFATLKRTRRREVGLGRILLDSNQSVNS